MRKSVSHAGAITLTLALGLTLDGCGSDGGGQVASANSTPPASNASLANLVASQSFANNAASETSTIAASANLTAASSVSQALTFSYDLTTNSYTVSTQGRSQTFAPANLSSPAANGVAVYAITNGATTDRLTLESASITGYGATYPQYSGLGYWQRTTTGASSSDVTVDFFIYGLPTTASAVPRSGSAAYATSVYGVVSPIGSEERFFQGTGRMDIDFKAGLLSTSATLNESGIVSQASYGSTATINGSGTLSSSGNAFSGAITYTGLNSTSTGSLQGQFYGPAAQEVGASFATSGADGSSASGVIWGNQNANLAPLNQSVSNIVTTQTFTSSEVQSPSGTIDTGQVTVTSAGGVTVSPAGLPSATFTSSQEVSGAPANFTGYGNGTTTVDLYKAGSANTELALTYLSFGSWHGPVASGSNTTATAWFAYGLGTSAAVIQARTGSANYTGVAYGTASTAASGTNAMVSGTASFAVNFDMNGYFGSFALKNATTDYGTFNVSGTIGSGTANRGGVTGVTAGSGTFLPAFFGPTGQEFGGPFQIAVPGTTIVGVAAGKGG